MTARMPLPQGASPDSIILSGEKKRDLPECHADLAKANGLFINHKKPPRRPSTGSGQAKDAKREILPRKPKINHKKIF